MTVEENGCTEFVCPEDFVPRVVSTFSRSSIETPPGFTDFTSFVSVQCRNVFIKTFLKRLIN